MREWTTSIRFFLPILLLIFPDDNKAVSYEHVLTTFVNPVIGKATYGCKAGSERGTCVDSPELCTPHEGNVVGYCFFEGKYEGICCTGASFATPLDDTSTTTTTTKRPFPGFPTITTRPLPNITMTTQTLPNMTMTTQKFPNMTMTTQHRPNITMTTHMPNMTAPTRPTTHLTTTTPICTTETPTTATTEAMTNTQTEEVTINTTPSEEPVTDSTPSEETTVESPPEETTTESAPEETTTESAPEETTTESPAENITVEASSPPEETATQSTPEDITVETSSPPEETTTESPAENITVEASSPPEETITESPPDITAEASSPPEETTTESPPEDITVEASSPAEESTTESPPEDITVEASSLPEDTTTESPPENITVEASSPPEETTTESPPEDITVEASSSPEETTTGSPEDITVEASSHPEETTTESPPEDITVDSSSSPDETTTESLPEETTIEASSPSDEITEASPSTETSEATPLPAFDVPDGPTGCGVITTDIQSYYKNPSYPSLDTEANVYVFSIMPHDGYCGLRIEFLEAIFASRGSEGCSLDSLQILNSADAPTTPLCGLMEGYQFTVKSYPEQPIQILITTQSAGHLWNIKFTQIHCDNIKPYHEYESPECGIKKSTQPSQSSSNKYKLVSPFSFLRTQRTPSKEMLHYPDLAPTKLLRDAVLNHPLKIKIFQGNETGINEWPWEALLMLYGRPLCAATLLNEEWALTSGKCVKLSLKYPLASVLTVDMGDHNLKSSKETRNIMVKVAKIVPNVQNEGVRNDIALIKLAHKITFEKTIRPVCLPASELSSDTYSGKQGITTGWGIKEDTVVSPVLRAASLPIISNDRCRQQWSAVGDDAGRLIEKDMICAGGDDVAPCNADSGGPLVIHDEEEGKWKLVGVGSFGFLKGCAIPDVPSVYARVTSFLDWIALNIAAA